MQYKGTFEFAEYNTPPNSSTGGLGSGAANAENTSRVVKLSAAQIASPTAAILADTTATYIGPNGARVHSTGTALVSDGAGGARDLQSYYGLRTGGFDNTALLGAAIADANGTPLWLPPGDFTVSDLTTVTSTSLIIEGPGRFIHSRKGVLLCNYSTTLVGNVSSINTAAYPSNISVAAATNIVLTAPPLVTVVRGDIILLRSDDDMVEQTGVKPGELLRVQEVSGSTLFCSGKANFTSLYVTTPKVYLMPSQSVSIKTNFYNPLYLTDSDTSGNPTVHIAFAKYPIVNSSFTGQANAAIQFGSCWEPSCDSSVIESRNTNFTDCLGYGVVINGATRHARIQIYGVNNRHTVTGGAIVGVYGVPQDNLIYDSYSIDPLSVGFDTHQSMYNTQFRDCVVRKSMGNPDENPGETPINAFGNRGANTSYINCRAEGFGGWILYEASFNRAGAAGKYTTRLINCVNQPDAYSSQVGIFVIAGFNGTVAGYHTVEIDGGSFFGTLFLMENTTSKVVLKGEPRFTQQDGSFACGDNNTVHIQSLRRDRPAGNLPCIEFGAGTTLIAEKYVADATGFSSNALFLAGSAAGTATLKFGSIYAPNTLPTQIATSTGSTTLVASSLEMPFEQTIAFNATTMSVNFALGTSVIFGTLTANVTAMSAPTNIPSAARRVLVSFYMLQDGTGGRTFTWNTKFVGAWPTGSGTANQKQMVIGESDGTNLIFRSSSGWYTAV
jgi:hypothetical protein